MLNELDTVIPDRITSVFIVSMEAIEHAPARLRPERHVLSRDYEQDGTLRIRIHDDGHGGWAWASLGRSETDHS